MENIQFELTMLLRLSIATVFGLLIGIERQRHGKIAGIRTFATLALGTALFTLLATQVGATQYDASIVAATIIGVGLLASKMTVTTIENEQDFSNVAAIWATAAISVAVALGLYFLSGTAAVLLLIIFWFKDLYNKN